MEKENFKIVPGEQKYYNQMLEIYKAGFLSKFRYIIRDEVLLQSFCHDFNMVSTQHGSGNFIAVKDDEVLGLLCVKTHEHSDDQYNALPAKKLMKKYGFLAIVRAILLGMAVNYHPPKGELYIDNISVSENARGQGVGTLLMNFAHDYAQKNGCTQLSLQVMDENPRAKALYERLGFKVVSHSSFRWLKKTTGYSGGDFMIKKLI